MKRILIVNADDANLTQGITEAILACHDDGIVTSTTWLVNRANCEKTVRAVQRRKGLGVGIHLNVTLGDPVSLPAKVKSLLQDNGQFKRYPQQLLKCPKAGELDTEYQNQIKRFKQLFGRLPTHLDTHHQLHDHPLFFKVIAAIAKQYRLPVRRCRLLRMAGAGPGKITTTDFIFGNLSPAGYWRREALANVLMNLPEGTSEIVCHPGKVDRPLAAITSFTTGRAKEFGLFRSGMLRKILEAHSVVLGNYTVL